ncbi:hypothetical protein [Arthrobacter sp. H5]|nr:hypothetical protein [Arthrobacter sp. H5]
MAEILPLTAEQLHCPAFFDLLGEAAGQDDHALRRITAGQQSA